MTYLDNGATSFHKPESVSAAMRCALENCANPGRGGHKAAMAAAKTVLRCREQAGALFHCSPEQVVMTGNCTHGLNMAIHTLVAPGSRVLISGFEHNAVTRPLYARNAQITVAGRKLFDWDNTLEEFENGLRKGVDAAVFTHVSNVFGYILPVQAMADLCRQYGVPFILDAAQSARMLDIDMQALGANFIAMPGHNGLLGPQGTGLLLCKDLPKPLLQGGTGSISKSQEMPDFLPDVGEAGTLNVPGIAGLAAGIAYVRQQEPQRILAKQQKQAQHAADGLEKLGFRVFRGPHQGGTVSFVPPMDCEEAAKAFADNGIAVRAGLHCAPLAHESAGTLDSGTVRISFGHDAAPWQTGNLLLEAEKLAVIA